MKTTIKFLSVLCLAALLFACSDDDGGIVGTTDNPLEIKASADTIILREGVHEEAVKFSWNSGNDRGPETTLSYLFKFDIADNEFNTTVPKEIMPEGVFSKAYSHEELQTLITEYWKIPPGEKVDLEAKVTATVTAPLFVKPEVSTVRIHVRTYVQKPYDLFIMGSATQGGNNPESALKLNETVPQKVYHWKGRLKEGEFKFIMEKGNLLPSFNRGEDHFTLVERTSESEPDRMFPVEKEGNYALALFREEMRLVYSPLPYERIFIVGNATPAQWTIEDAIELEWNPDEPHLFTYEGPLYEGELKFPMWLSWSADYLMPVVNGAGTDDNRVQFVAGGKPDYKWKITESGEYKIILNIPEMTITFIKK